jgi:hypothetical protein
MSIDQRPNMLWCGRALLALFLMVLLHAPAELLAQEGRLRVGGGKLQWSGQLVSGWVGGHAAQIERIMVATDNEMLRTIFREMLLDAQKLDAYFVHTDVTGTTTKTLTSLRINVLRLESDLADQETQRAVWQSYAGRLNDDGPPGSQTTVESDEASETGGLPAYTAVFRTNQRDGGVVYTILYLVSRGGGAMHMFQMKADAKKFRARFAELSELLRSVRYMQ